VHYVDGMQIHSCATENGVTILSSLDTVHILPEDVVPKISTFNA